MSPVARWDQTEESSLYKVSPVACWDQTDESSLYKVSPVACWDQTQESSLYKVSPVARWDKTMTVTIGYEYCAPVTQLTSSIFRQATPELSRQSSGHQWRPGNSRDGFKKHVQVSKAWTVGKP